MFIAPFMQSITILEDGGVYFEVRGEAPNRRVIVQWDNVYLNTAYAPLTWQAILYEGSNEILIQYLETVIGLPVFDYGSAGTAGIQHYAFQGEEYSCRTPSLTPGLAVRYSPQWSYPVHPPAADAGGPYDISWGSGITLSGSATAGGNAVEAYRWDLDGDGAFDDAEGAGLSLTWPEISSLVCGGTCAGGGNRAIGLRAYDSDGAMGEDVTTLSISGPPFETGNDMAFDFGSADGVWAWYNNDGSSWNPVSGLSTEAMTMGDLDGNGQEDLLLGFCDTYGLWAWYNNDHGSWAPVSGLCPERVVTGDLDGNGMDDVILDFGPAYGVWAWYNNDLGSWAPVSSLITEDIAIGDLDGNGMDDVILDFGPVYGVWAWYNNDHSSWKSIATSDPSMMEVADLDKNGQDDVVFCFGSTGVVWAWYNNDPATWAPVTNISPESISSGEFDADGREDVVFDFGADGIWIWHNNDPADWTRISGLDPEIMEVGDLDRSGEDDLIIDYGPANGIWVLYNSDPTTWDQISGLSPEGMACGNIDGQ
jgi:hypothetical protein